MRRSLIRAATWVLKALCAADHRRFMVGLDDVAGAQARLKQRLTRDLADTEYGRRFPNPPLAGWADLEPRLNRQINGELRVIARDRFVHVEPTSGSSGAVKRVPYTRAMMGVFGRMFRIWAYDVLRDLNPETGRIFISQSPRGDVRRETKYLGGPLEVLLSPFLIRLKHDRPFLDDLALTLLAARDLEVISVWSPSYLTVVLDHIDRHGLGDWRAAWPKLKLISCWDQGQAAAIADDLRARFPGVRVQGKGLLSTEAPITVPIDGIGCLPMYQDILFEFLVTRIPADMRHERRREIVSASATGEAGGGLLGLHELEDKQAYELVITTPSGLIRYRTGDLIRATGHYRSCPILAFEGRTGNVSDLAGEKLSEAFVRQALTSLIPSGRFILLPTGNHYVLLSEIHVDSTRADAALRAAHHYELARDQGQLKSLEVRTTPSLLEMQKQFFAAQGQDFGHIKDTALISDPDRAAAFLHFVKTVKSIPANTASSPG